MTTSPDAPTDRPGHGPAPEQDSGLAELLDLDAVHGATVLDRALDRAATALGDEPRAVVDLGAGTGTGTLALAARFGQARVHALDATSSMLDRLRVGADAAGVGDRVEAHLVDLDDDWPAVLPGTVDLAWAALSLHHVSDPERVLRQAFDALRPGGVLVVIEMTPGSTFEPADLGTGRDGLGPRVTAAMAAQGYPVTAEWTAQLEAAGFGPVEREETPFAASAATADGARYLALQLGRHHARLSGGGGSHGRGGHHEGGHHEGGHHHGSRAHHAAAATGVDPAAVVLDAADLDALGSAVTALEQGRSDLTVTTARAVWTAVRPRS